MSRNPMIPPNFVTLRKLKELKEKREEEERLKREDEERTRKLKEVEEEEQERPRKLEQEEESLKKIPKTIGSNYPYHRKRRQGRARSLRRSANRDGQVAVEGRSTDLETSAHKESKEEKKNEGQFSRNWRAKPDAQLSRGGRSSGANLEAQVAENRRSKMELRTLEESKKGRMKKWMKNRRKQPSKGREGEVTEMPFSLNGSEVVEEGFGAPTKVKGEKITKVIVVDVNESEWRNGFGALKNEEEEKPTRITVDVNGSYWPVRYIGSESGLVADIEKRVSDLKMSGENPNPNRRGRGRGFGNCGRGGGRPSVYSGRGRSRSNSGMMWVKKMTES